MLSCLSRIVGRSVIQEGSHIVFVGVAFRLTENFVLSNFVLHVTIMPMFRPTMEQRASILQRAIKIPSFFSISCDPD